MVIDKDATKLQKLAAHLDVMTVEDNGKDLSVLRDANVASYDYLLASTDEDEKNMTIACFAKKLGCSNTLARIRDPEYMNHFDFIRDTMSIDAIYNPDMSISLEIYKYLVEKYTLSNGIFTSRKVSLIEFHVGKMPKLIGKAMKEIPPHLENMLVVALSRNGKVIIPHGEDTIGPDDELYVIGEKGPIEKLQKKVHERGRFTDLQKVMIIGGGKTGLFLSKKLADFGISVKIIEADKQRCFYLSERLKDVMVLHGDGTDMSLLEEENISNMDAVVTATGFDEDNLLLALMAKRQGVEDVIAKVSRDIYTDMVADMGVEMALNPLDITARNILRMVQGSRRTITSQLIQGQAEVMEIHVTPDMRFINKPIKSLELPKSMLFAAIHRGMEVIIPNGDTVIEVDDKVLIIALLSDLPSFEQVLCSSHRGSI